MGENWCQDISYVIYLTRIFFFKLNWGSVLFFRKIHPPPPTPMKLNGRFPKICVMHVVHRHPLMGRIFGANEFLPRNYAFAMKIFFRSKKLFHTVFFFIFNGIVSYSWFFLFYIQYVSCFEIFYFK